jgi:hypothetical protein
VRRAVFFLAVVACSNPQVTAPQTRSTEPRPSSDEYTAIALDAALCFEPMPSECRLLVLFASGICDHDHGSQPATTDDVDGIAALCEAHEVDMEGTLCTVTPSAICDPLARIDRNDRAWRACRHSGDASPESGPPSGEHDPPSDGGFTTDAEVPIGQDDSGPPQTVATSPPQAS